MTILDKGMRVTIPESMYADGRGIQRVTAGFTVTAEYTNYTTDVIFIKTQTNMPFALEPNISTMNTDEQREHIEIKLVYKLSNNGGISGTTELLTALVSNEHLLSDDAIKLHEKLMDIYRKDASRNNKMNFSFTVFRRVMDVDLVRNRMVYLRECDVILSKDKEAMSLPHPNSSTGLQQIEISNNKLYAGQAGVFVKVVDNEQLAIVRYYYAGKQLISVPSIIDPALESGVYYTISSQSSDGGVMPRTAVLSFAEAETTLGLYRFKDDALSHGNPEIFLRAEEARHKLEARQAELTLQRNKSEVDGRTLEIEAELLELRRSLEHQKTLNASLKDSLDLGKAVRDDRLDSGKKGREKKKLKEEQRAADRQAVLDAEKKSREDYYDRLDKERKDHFEHRSYDRKDTSELIKYVPALMLGIIGTFAFIKAKQ